VVIWFWFNLIWFYDTQHKTAQSPSSAFTVVNSFQLSASSSVAILNDTQRAALQYVITRSAQDSKSVASKLLSRVQRLGYSKNDLKRYMYDFDSGNIFAYTLL